MPEAVADISEFPFVKGLPKREKSRLAKLWDAVSELERLNKEHGALLTQTQVATMLGVSQQRVAQLMDAGRLQVVQVLNTRYVPASYLREFAKQSRPTGRPPGKRRLGLLDAVKFGVQSAVGIADAAGID